MRTVSTEQTTPPEHSHRRLATWVSVVALGGFLFGYDTGVISGALLFIREDFALGAFRQGMVVAALLLGAMIGAIIGGRYAAGYGRRPTLAVVAAVFTGGLIVAALAPGFWVLVLARLILGLAVGAGSAVVPLYLSEVAPTRARGRLVAMNQLLITVGILVSYIVDYAFSESGNWRAMFACGIVPSALMLLGMLLVPETPAWLEGQGRHPQAESVLSRLLPRNAVDETLHGYKRAREEEERQVSYRQLLSRTTRPALFIGVTLAAIQQFVGINTIIYFAPSIMETTGLSASNSIVSSIVIGGLNVLMTIVSIPLVDRLGRRPLLLVSLFGMLAALIPLGIAFIAAEDTASSSLSLICILVYIAAFAIGLGPVFWLLIAEIFPPNERARGASVATTVNWGANLVVGQLFLPVVDIIGQGQTFLLFAAVCVLSLIYVARRVPETKNRTFVDIDEQLRRRA